MRKKFKKIAILGESIKFKKIISSIFNKSKIQVFSWRKIENKVLDKRTIIPKVDLILVCGYDFKSNWYSYNEYYRVNVALPFKFIKLLSTKKTLIIYINTTNKIKQNLRSNKKITFSRYEFAKKELSYKLNRNFNNLRILSLPIIKNSQNKVQIFGNNFMRLLFDFLLYINLINSINLIQIKKLILNSIKVKKKIKLQKVCPVGLSIRRSLFLDRLLRFIND